MALMPALQSGKNNLPRTTLALNPSKKINPISSPKDGQSPIVTDEIQHFSIAPKQWWLK